MAVNCEDIQSRLQEYVTRELVPARRAEVDAHLVECPECQRELALLTALVSTLDSQPVIEPGPDFTARVIRRLPGRRRAPLSPWWALAAAPMLGVIAWLSRGTLLRWVAAAADRIGLSASSVPSASGVGYAQLTWVAVALAVFTVGVLVAGAYYGWRVVRDR